MTQKLLPLRSRFAYESGRILVATVIGSGLGWVYHIFVARTLGVEKFGLFEALAGIFYVAMLGGVAFRTEIAAITARVASRLGEDEAIGNFIRVGKRFLIIFLPVPLIFIAASKFIASSLNAQLTGVVIILGFAIFGNLIFTVTLGLLQGLQRYMQVATIGYLLPPALKLLMGMLFITIGWNLMGALGAILTAEFCALTTVLVLWRKRLSSARHRAPVADALPLKIVLPGLVFAFFIAAPTNLDVLIVTAIFSAREAGIYACAATLGKILTFLSIAVALPLLPMVAERRSLNMPSVNLALQGLVFVLLLTGAVTLLYWLCPGLIITLFFGHSYLGATALIGWYGVAMMIFALNLLLLQYAVAVGRRRHIWLAGIMTVGIILTISAWHTSLRQIIMVLVAGNAALFIYNSLTLLNVFHRGKSELRQTT